MDKGFFEDTKVLGMFHNVDYVVPMDPRTFTEFEVEPEIAIATRSEEHIQMALQLAGAPI